MAIFVQCRRIGRFSSFPFDFNQVTNARYGVIKQRQSGMTLIEVMIVTAIVAILSTIAYPSYTQYIARSKRSAIEAYMMGLANRQQQHLLDTKSYFCSTGNTCADVIALTVPDDLGRDYAVSVAAPATTGIPTYTITATPQGGQASADAKCGTLTLDHTGLKTASAGTAANCW